MRRREFIALVGGAAAWPSISVAQQSDRPRQIAAFISGDASTAGIFAKSFKEGLGTLGWTEGTNIKIEQRWLREGVARLSSDVADVVALAPEVVVSGGTEATIALKEKTGTIPIVFVHVADPLSAGLVQSLARPAGNITGFAAYESSIGGKWLEILKELAPHLKHVMLLVDRQNLTWRMHVPTIEGAAPSFNVQLTAKSVANAQDIENAIKAFAEKPNAGMIVLPSLMLDNQHRRLILALATKHRLPTISGARGWIATGGLIYYSSDWAALYRRSAEYVDKILRGATPADLPVQQPIKFELVINLKTAKALDLTVPPSLLARADEVIE